MLFYVEAIDSEGKKIKKTYEVNDEAELLQVLEFSNLIPVKIIRLPIIFKFFSPKSGRIKKREIIEVLESLHLIVKSGLPINTGLLDLAKDVENPALREILNEIAYKIQIGYSLSQAVEPYKKYFSDVVVSLFRIGEETGSLDKTLKDAAEHLKRIEDLKSKAKQALIYPAFALVSIVGAMLFWLIVVLPKIMNVFKEFDMELPITTIIVMKMSEYTQRYALDVIGGIIVFFIVLKIARSKNEKVKYVTDRIILNLPIFGNILKNFNFAFFAEYIKLMISAGMPLYRSLEVIYTAMSNEVFRRSIKEAREEIGLGRSFSDALKKGGIFSTLIIRMVNVGEQTGQLENQLEYIAEYYYNKVDYISQNIAKMIEPILIGFLGLFLLIIVLGLIGPIYQLISNVSRV